MRIIKRYPNRKLYDTEAKQYITLDEIANLIREGIDIRVIDHATEEDITTLTLTQIIYEQEKKQTGFFPSTLLADLIQASGEHLANIQKLLSASINYWHQIDEEIRIRVQKLVKQGELTETEGLRMIEKLIQPDSQFTNSGEQYEKEIQMAITRRRVPTRKEIQDLIDQIDALTDQLEKGNPAK